MPNRTAINVTDRQSLVTVDPGEHASAHQQKLLDLVFDQEPTPDSTRTWTRAAGYWQMREESTEGDGERLVGTGTLGDQWLLAIATDQPSVAAQLRSELRERMAAGRLPMVGLRVTEDNTSPIPGVKVRLTGKRKNETTADRSVVGAAARELSESYRITWSGNRWYRDVWGRLDASIYVVDDTIRYPEGGWLVLRATF